MAQWLGQFTGKTHATKVQDAEDALRHAIAVFHASASGEREPKAKSVRNLAERLLAARLKLLKARIAASQPVADDRQPPDGEIESLTERQAKLTAEGLDGILAEFGVQDALR